MSITFSLAVYFMMWWIVLFAILPFGRPQTQEEAGEIVPGSEPSAPTRPRFLRVIIWTTIVTTILFAGFYYLRMSGFGLDDFPI